MKAYHQTAQEIMIQNQTTQEGLSKQEALRRFESHGENKLQEGKRKSLWQRIWEQVRDPMILVLIAAGVISGLYGEFADMAIIFMVVVINAILGIVQENKAEKAIDALNRLSSPHARVRREGMVSQIQTRDIVFGDIVLLEAGDAIPADLRLIEAVSLKIEEAALTGESVPADKQSEVIDAAEGEVSLGDQVNMAFMGTHVAYGRAEGVVIATGMDTQMGKIAKILANTQIERTPLQQKLASLSKVLSVAVLGICLFIFLFNVFVHGGGEVFDAFLTAVSLAVAAIPEGLVVVVTVLLSIGITKMSKRNAIIRRLTAVETLGCTQVICSDKTGTLTQNHMTVVEHFGPEQLLSTAMALCCDVQAGSEGILVGDPTEIALYEYARRVQPDGVSLHVPRVCEAPFDSIRKMMSTVHQGGDRFIQYTKGAPDEIIARCQMIEMDGQQMVLTDELREQAMAANQDMTGKALRVLGAAYRIYDENPCALSPERMEQEMTFIGLAGMIDPIRPEVKAAIQQCKSAGIRAVMITGDHKDTAIAIAMELGILTDKSQAISGAELSMIDESEFEARIHDICVYARVQPEHKVRIVNTWRKLGRITAMTGDGVNDAPAIKNADIGVGMGITGTDVTKNVADMVLLDDNFATIVYAVEEGRRIYENIRKAIQFLLSSNLSEVVAIFIATLCGWKLFSPIHILWINLITDTFPAMALGMEQAEPDLMKKPPRSAKETVFADGLGAYVLYQGVIVALLTLASFVIGNAQTPITGMTMAFLTLSLCEIFHSLNMRSRHISLFRVKGHNRYLSGAMVFSFILTFCVIYIPGLNSLFELTALPAGDFFIALGLAFLIIPIVEIVKLINRLANAKKHKNRG